MMHWIPPDARRLLALLRPWRSWMMLGTLLAGAAALAAAGLMAVSGWFIASMGLAGVTGAALNYYTPAAAIRGFAIARAGGRYGERLATHDATLRVLAGLRAWLFLRLIPLAPARLAALRSAELFARLRADVDALEQFYLAVLVPVIVAAVGLLAVSLLALVVLPISVLPLAVALAAAVAVPRWAGRRRAVDAGALARESAALRGVLMDSLRGRAELLAFGAADVCAARVATLDARLAARRARMDRLDALGGGLALFAAQLTVLAILVPGLAAVHAAHLAPPLLVMLSLLTLAAFELAAPLAPALTHWHVSRAAAQRVFELIDMPPAVSEPSAPRAIPGRPSVRFENVRLRYPDGSRWALDGADLELAPGERLAIVRPSGAGKTGLLNALQKFLPLQGGRIVFGGEPLEVLDGDDVRRHIAVIAQRSALFNLSLRDNLLLGAPAATPTQLDAAIQAAQLDAFVASLPEGLDTPMGEGGGRASGGEARRITIARALLQNAPILVLDEPTEGLDAATAARLYAALAAATRGRSVLLVTHRLGQLATLVDRVAVMHAGRIVRCVDARAYLEGVVRGARPDGAGRAPARRVLGRIEDSGAGQAPVLPEQVHGGLRGPPRGGRRRVDACE